MVPLVFCDFKLAGEIESCLDTSLDSIKAYSKKIVTSLRMHLVQSLNSLRTLFVPKYGQGSTNKETARLVRKISSLLDFASSVVVDHIEDGAGNGTFTKLPCLFLTNAHTLLRFHGEVDEAVAFLDKAVVMARRHSPNELEAIVLAYL
jgi:hypothetical protein